MITLFKKTFLYMLIFLLLVEPCFGYVTYSYSGEIAPVNFWSSYQYSPELNSGRAYEPVYYSGTEYIPISNSGTLYKGVYYNGIALSEIKVTTIKISGNETSEQIFKAAIEGASDGFMWGAISGAVTGAVTSYAQLSKGTAILNSKGKVAAVVDDNSQIVFEPRSGRKIGIAKGKLDNGQYFCYFDEVSKSYKTFDGVVLKDFKVSDFIFSQGDDIVGVVDDSTGLLALGDDAIKLLMEKYGPIKANPTIKELDVPYVYNGTLSHAKVLKRNYELATGVKIPKNANGHHIVPWDHRDAARAREILAKFGIDIDDAANCAVLPSGSDALSKAIGMMNHAKVHSKAYHSALTEKLLNCQSKEDVLDVLDLFRSALYNNTPFW